MKSGLLLAVAFGAAAPVATAAAASLTGASPGFHYFWKQDATMADHDAAMVDCAVRMRAMVNGSDAMTAISSSTGGGLAGALIGGIIDNNENRQGSAANTEGCMALKGWSVVALSDEEGHAMEAPDDPAAVHEKLKSYVEALAPRGPVLRGPFANELAVGNFVVEKARDLEEVSFSVRATRDLRDMAVEAAGDLKPPKPPKLPDGVKAPKPAKAEKADALAIATTGARLVMRVSYSRGSASLFDVMFNRLTPDGAEVVYDGAATAAKTVLAKSGKGERNGVKYFDYVIPVPPGVWKLGALTNIQYAADLCLGAPAFVVGEDETVFVGEMTIREAGGYPLSADIAVAREILAANPALAEKVRPVAWTNGFTADCFGSYAYAYEIPGAPFVGAAAVASSSDTISSEAAPDE